MQYISKQFNGPRVQSITNCTEATIEEINTSLDYLSELSIDTANEQHLEFIGKLIGFNRPTISSDVFNASLLRFSEGKQVSNVNGLSSLSKAVGIFGSLISDEAEIKLPLQSYRACLKALVKVNTDGTTLVVNSMTYLVSLIKQFSNTFTISFVTFNDIVVAISDLSPVDLTILDIVVKSLFNTAPIITLADGRNA